MARNLYAQPAEANIQPMDFSIYMAAQKAGFEAQQNQLQLEAQVLQNQAKDVQAGSDAIMGTMSALDSIKAYGEEDQERLGQIRAGYRERLQGLVKQGIEGGGLHTMSNALRLESARLQQEVSRGELGGIGTRYQVSQENLETLNDLYSKGKISDYNRWYYGNDLLQTPKESPDILGATTDFATANGLKHTDGRVLGQQYIQAAHSMFPEEFQKMRAYDAATGGQGNAEANMVNSLMNAATIQTINGPGGGGPHSTLAGGMQNSGVGSAIVGTGAGYTTSRGVMADGLPEWAKAYSTKDNVLQTMTEDLVMSESLITNDANGQHEVFNKADEKLQQASYAYSGIDPSDMNKVTNVVQAQLVNYGIKSLDQDNSKDSEELIAAINDKDKYDDFKIIGYYTADNPIYPGGYAATAVNQETGVQENFIVGNPGSTQRERQIFEASQPFFNKNMRASGQKSYFNINVSDSRAKGYTTEDPTVSGAIMISDTEKDANRTKYQMVTQAQIVDNGAGEPEWQIIADIINTQTGERIDISGDKGYSTLAETLEWLDFTYMSNYTR